MYPKKFWDEFRLPKWRDEIFVGMWFDKDNIAKRYDTVIKNAIEGTELKPRLLNEMITGDSIPSDIMRGIIECKLVLFDISPMKVERYFLTRKVKSHIRNPNVMYELGLAHTWRNNEEVIIIRDDNGNLPFDIQSMGVVQYSLEDSNKSIDKIRETILFRLQEIEKSQKSMVRKAAESLNIEAHTILIQSKGLIFHDKTFPEALRLLAIPLLLDLGLIEMLTDIKGYGYHPTQLGREVILYYNQPLEPDNLKEVYKTLYRDNY